MPWCPECRAEYQAGASTCSDCEVALVDVLGPGPAEPVVLLKARTADEARIIVATLEAEGIQAYVADPATVIPASNTVPDISDEFDVLVPGDELAQALQVLAEPAVTEAELTEAEETRSGGETDLEGDEQSAEEMAEETAGE